ncbi:hypothetical protein HRbin40_00461 [bacterium HR40]|nr:hypothetical protein HRbin40_00461 [bacterium HR40]
MSVSNMRPEGLVFGLAALVLLPFSGVAGEDFGLGVTPTPEQIAGWDKDVRPDGVGLPPGRGTAAEGEPLYLEKCAVCHGEFGEGIDRWPVLAGGFDTLKHQWPEGRPEKTVGSYWPYSSTLFDYIWRAMPFPEPKSLTPDEVYAIAAYVLYLNDIVGYDEELNQDNFAKIAMPNRDGFVPDTRPDVPVGGEPCMKDCPVDTTIIGRAAPLQVTPEDKKEPAVD